jgi:hypothetical protein
MPKREHDIAELRKAYEHVKYEFEMLTETATLLQSHPTLTEAHQRAILESFVIHFRNLLEFFYWNPGEDRILAEHFAPGAWRDKRPKKSALLFKGHSRACNEIAHLTFARLGVRNEDWPWPVAEITKEMSELYDLFLKLAPQDLPKLTPVQFASANIVSVTNTVSFRHSTNTSNSVTISSLPILDDKHGQSG